MVNLQHMCHCGLFASLKTLKSSAPTNLGGGSRGKVTPGPRAEVQPCLNVGEETAISGEVVDCAKAWKESTGLHQMNRSWGL